MARRITYRELPEGVTRKRQESSRVFSSYSSLDWYKLTERTRHVLNTILSSTAKKQVEEQLKDQPDPVRLDAYRSITQIITDLSRNPKNFDSKDRMQKILEVYAPLEVI